MKKEITPHLEAAPPVAGAAWLDLEATAHVRLTSEDPDYPIESALLETQDQKGWRAIAAGPQTIWISFNTPQHVIRINLCFDIPESRTQEFLLSSSTDGGRTFHEIVRQQYNFSSTSPHEEETYSPNLPRVTDVKLTITPDISNGPAKASLKRLQIAGRDS